MEVKISTPAKIHSLCFFLILCSLLSCATDNKESSLSESSKNMNPVDTLKSSPDTVSDQISESNRIHHTTHSFEKIQTSEIPPFEDVMRILDKSKLKSSCIENEVDQLDIDLMFMKSGTLPFDQFKVTQLKDGTQRRYMDLFNEKDLKTFYEEARKYLKKNQSK
jgi:hypothetical protein